MYYSTMKKSWYIEAYTFNGAVLCRQCVADTLNDEGFADPYNLDEHESFKPMFASDIDYKELAGMICDYCYEEVIPE